MATNPMTEPGFAGFRSPEAKQQFTVSAAVLAGAILIAQFVLPMWLAGLASGRGGQLWAIRMENVRAEGLVIWRGDLWYVSGEISSGFESRDSRLNNQLVRLTAGGPTTVCALGAGAVWLMPGGNDLWIISGDGLSRFDGKTVHYLPAKKLAGQISQPFLLNGRLSVVQEQAGTRSVQALAEDEWREVARIHVTDMAEASLVAGDLKVLTISDRPYVFCRKGGSVYCYNGFPGEKVAFPSGWEPVGFAGEAWTVASAGGRPAVFAVNAEKNSLASEIVEYNRGQDGWRKALLRKPGFPPRSIGAAFDEAKRATEILYQALPWSLNLLEAQNEKVIGSRRFGELIPRERGKLPPILLLPASSIALSLLLVVGFAYLMKVHRVDLYPGAGPEGKSPLAAAFRAGLPRSDDSMLRGAPPLFASLARRAVAFIIDAAIVVGPTLVALASTVWVLSRIEDRPELQGMLSLFSIVPIALLWAVVGTLLFCYTLGQWGRTPGKWAMGIRVVALDLRPCGFGRALLRTLALFLDIFILNCMVGVVLIGFTRNWQRAGDAFARTIVIRDGPQPISPMIDTPLESR